MANGAGPFGSEAALSAFLTALAGQARLAPPGPAPEKLWPDFDPAARQARQLHELDRHTQWLLTESPYTRQKFMAKLDTTSPEKFRQSAEGYRDFFYDEVIGRFDEPLLPANPRSRKTYDQPKWTGYEVVLDVFPDVIAYGVLLLPKDLKPGERRPVVVCQHGLEGRPQDTITGDSQYYHDFAAKLCEQGFITFAPQNLYHLPRPLSHPAAQGQSAGQDLVFDHRAPASADHRLAQDAAVCGPGADCFLRPELRRQDGHARAGRW